MRLESVRRQGELAKAARIDEVLLESIEHGEYIGGVGCLSMRIAKDFLGILWFGYDEKGWDISLENHMGKVIFDAKEQRADHIKHCIKLWRETSSLNPEHYKLD